MKTEVTLREAVGKVLTNVAFSEWANSGKCVLVFSDETFTTLGIERGYEADDEEIREDKINLLEFGDEILVRVGIATREELATIRSERKKRMEDEIQARTHERDLREFERLKRIFNVECKGEDK